MKIDVLTLKKDLTREIEDSRRRIQKAECILEYLEQRFAEIQPEPPQTPDSLSVTKRELIKKTGEKLRRPFNMHDVKNYACQKDPNLPFDPTSLKKVFRKMVDSGELIKVRQGRPGPKWKRTNLYKLAPQR